MLEFLIGLYKVGDEISFECERGEIVSGTIVKLTEEAIAIQSENVLIIKKDNEVRKIHDSEIKVLKVGTKTLGKLVYSLEESALAELLRQINLYKNTIVGWKKGQCFKSCGYITSFQKQKNTYNAIESKTGKEIKNISQKTIVDPLLLEKLNKIGQLNNRLEVFLFYSYKDKEKVRLAISTDSTFGDYVDLFEYSVIEKHLFTSRLICDLLLLLKLGDQNLLNTISKSLPRDKEVVFSPTKPTLTNEGVKYNCQIQTLFGQEKYEEVITISENALLNQKNDKKVFLTHKATALSRLTRYSEAADVYKSIIDICQNGDSVKPTYLSSLYFEFAKNILLSSEDFEKAKSILVKALEINNKNQAAQTLLDSVENGTYTRESIPEDANEMLIDCDEDQTVIVSSMIDLDIKAYTYTDENIIRNNGIPTLSIYKSLFNKAKESLKVESSLRDLKYPLFLEAAKAYCDLTEKKDEYKEDYNFLIAKYALMKGNSLSKKFITLIKEGNTNIEELTRLCDSSCSYYLVALNLVDVLTPKDFPIIVVLTNYLKMNLTLKSLNQGLDYEFRGNFSDVFVSAIESNISEVVTTAWTVLITLGAYNTRTWNVLTMTRQGTGIYFSNLRKNHDKRIDVFKRINEIFNYNIDVNSDVKSFFKQAFDLRKDKVVKFQNFLEDFVKYDIEISYIQPLLDKWNEINNFGYEKIVAQTDIESVLCINDLLRILIPYSNRNENERRNLLDTARRRVEKQINFINDNTTYYGRTFFFTILKSIHIKIESALEKKYNENVPHIDVFPDPPYIINNGSSDYINLVVKNIGESTADSFVIKPLLMIDNERIIISSIEYDQDFQSGSSYSIRLDLPVENIPNDITIELQLTTEVEYNGDIIEGLTKSYTIEIEPTNYILNPNEVLWKESGTPSPMMFKGREKILNELIRHYLSKDRDKPYMLYGLTRTGKSSLVEYLKNNIKGKTIVIGEKELTILPFDWNVGISGIQSKFWEYLLVDSIFNLIPEDKKCNIHIQSHPTLLDFEPLLWQLRENGIYPLICIDEFSNVKKRMNDGLMTAETLQEFRDTQFKNLVSFIFAGTYDIKDLVTDPEYGITGQLVSIIDRQINEIDFRSAEELMDVMSDKLKFTQEAKNYLHTLTGDVPYFIQGICKRCGDYAFENRRTIIGYPELEYIIKILTEEIDNPNEYSLVGPIPDGYFDSNMVDYSDNISKALYSTIAYINRNNYDKPRGVSMKEIEDIWKFRGVENYSKKISDSIKRLELKRIIVKEPDEDRFVYRLRVDFFRRWWRIHHSDLDVELGLLN